MEIDIFHLLLKFNVRWNDAVGAATRYWMECPEIKFQRWRKFPQHSSVALRPTLPPVQRETALFVGGIAAGAWL